MKIRRNGKRMMHWGNIRANGPMGLLRRNLKTYEADGGGTMEVKMGPASGKAGKQYIRRWLGSFGRTQIWWDGIKYKKRLSGLVFKPSRAVKLTRTPQG